MTYQELLDQLQELPLEALENKVIVANITTNTYHHVLALELYIHPNYINPSGRYSTILTFSPNYKSPFTHIRSI